jgi:hypothetical protein
MPKQLKVQLLAIAKSPWFIVFGVSIVILALNIMFIGRLRPFSSDDVYWQLAVKDWKPFSGDTLYFGYKDIFVGLGPFFALMEHVFNPSRRLLIVEALMLVIGSFTLFYFSSLYFLKKLRFRLDYPTLLPFVWLASFGYPIVVHYLNVDYRSFELGLGFATYALAAAITHNDIDPLKSWLTRFATLCIVGLNAVLAYGDPYYTFFILAPIGLFTIGLHISRKISRRPAIILYASLALIVILSKILTIIGKSAGIIINTDAESIYVTFESIINNILTSFHGMFYMFGADFPGREVGNIVTFGMMLNAALLVLTIYAAVRFKKLFRIKRLIDAPLAKLWALFFILVLSTVFAVYTSSSLVSLGGYRFYLLFAWLAATYLSIAMGAVKNRQVAIGVSILLLLATLFNLAYTVVGQSTKGQPEVMANRKNQVNYALVEKLDQLGLNKGYANFWQANINTYLSSGKILFLSVTCTENGQTTPFKWLTTSSRLEKHSDNSFYLLDPYIAGIKTCTQEDVVRQFNEPESTVDLGGRTLMIFNYDISSKFL